MVHDEWAYDNIAMSVLGPVLWCVLPFYDLLLVLWIDNALDDHIWDKPSVGSTIKRIRVSLEFLFLEI